MQEEYHTFSSNYLDPHHGYDTNSPLPSVVTHEHIKSEQPTKYSAVSCQQACTASFVSFGKDITKE